jgi:hypothetical protein
MRREAVLVMQVEMELSQRRACGLMERNVHLTTRSKPVLTTNRFPSSVGVT